MRASRTGFRRSGAWLVNTKLRASARSTSTSRNATPNGARRDGPSTRASIRASLRATLAAASSTSGGGGGSGSEDEEVGSHPGAGYSKEARVDSKGVIHTPNVEDAARALFEKRKVELNQPRQVATLITRLGEIAKDMVAKGEKAPVFNLCDVTVKGTNLFCVESKGIPRVEMPQLTDDQTLNFHEKLAEKGYKVTLTSELASHLRQHRTS